MSKAIGTYSYRNIWKVAYPILISLVMEQMIGLTDTAFLGRVGEIELGASAIAIVYYMVLFMIGFGFSLGAQIIIGRRNGEGNFRETGRIFWKRVFSPCSVEFVTERRVELMNEARENYPTG